MSDKLKATLMAGLTEISEHAKDGMRKMAEVARSECRRANTAEAKLEKALTAHEKSQALLFETQRRLADIEARYTPLVQENDETREKLTEALKGLERANGLWWYWRDNDISETDDHWADFTNAVYAHLDGGEVPARFIARRGEKP